MPAPRSGAVFLAEAIATMTDRPISMWGTRTPSRVAALALAAWLAAGVCRAQDGERLEPVRLRSRITRVQPMTGIVLWATSEHNKTNAIQLEFSYMKYGDIVKERGRYDWRAMDRLLDRVAARRHQAIVRFYYVYPGNPTTVPGYIRAMPDYHETRGESEGKPTGFSDWSHPALREFTLEFYEKMAERYDNDPRLAFVETGFGLWAEYHIYSGPRVIGKTFPDKEFQAAFALQLGRVFRKTPWMISIDAIDDLYSPFAARKDLLALPFGVFDDSFLCQQHARVNELNWNGMGRDRWKRAPAGGEISYYTTRDQKEALAVGGPHRIPFENAAADFHITFMIANDQPKYRPMDRIRSAGLACGYRFHITGFEAGAKRSRVTVANRGVAPIYHDAFLAINGVRSERSLKGLLPGESRTDEIASGGASPKLTIACDRLVPGQSIDYEANLEGSPR
jgi:hypothetical protein